MNTLLDRYLAAIGRELPLRQSQEIIAELRDVLLSKIEDKEAELGRPLADREIEQLLIDFGHPLIVAGGYRKTPWLIGPELFPLWVATMRFALVFWGAILLVSLFVAAVATPSATPQWLLQKAGEALWPGFIGVFGVITLVFAVNERMGKYRFKLHFDPRRLPPPRARGRKPAQIVSEMVLGAAALLWWIGLIQFRAIMPIPAFLGVHLASTWDPFRAPIAAFLATEILINGLDLARPARVRLTASLGLVKNLAGAAIMVLVLQAGHWVEIVAPSLSPAVREMIRQGFDHGLRIGLAATLVVLVFKAGSDGLRLWRALGRDGGRAGNGASATAAAG
jgi:hypothetical protein